MAEFVSFDKPTTCPFCGKENEAVSPPGDDKAPPSDGDFSFCFSCGEWAIFDSILPGGVRKPNFGEYFQIVQSPMARAMRDGWLQVMKEEAKT